MVSGCASARERVQNDYISFSFKCKLTTQERNGQPRTEQPGDQCAQQTNEQTNILYASEHLHPTMNKKNEERIKIHNSSVIFW